jgi:hypothetical protein
MLGNATPRNLRDPARCASKRLSIGTLAFAVVLLGAELARTQGLVEYRFTGVVTDNTGGLGIFGFPGTVQIGDDFSGRFSYLTGPGNADQDPGDATIGIYDVADFAIDQAFVSIVPFVIGVTHRPGLPTLPPTPPDVGADVFTVAGLFSIGPDLETRPVSLLLQGPYQSVFTDDSLPADLSLSDFTNSQIVRSIRVLGIGPDGMSQIDEGQLTSLVKIPEPSSLSLALLATISLGLTRKRFRNHEDSRP